MRHTSSWLVVVLSVIPFQSSCVGDGARELTIATFNTSLNRAEAGALVRELEEGSEQARAVAEIIQRTRPDIILLNELDYDSLHQSVELFHDSYLAVSQNRSGVGGAEPITYPYRFAAPVNTGVASGFDLDNDGAVGESGRAYGNDAYGFGLFPGQYGMAVLSKYPIDRDRVRTFRTFLWRDMPEALLPTDPATGEPWYSDDELTVLRLSSKSHWDVPITVGDTIIHVLASHPTPPVFDGREDRNGTRNHDEIRFWADYLDPGLAGYIYDDAGRRGGLDPSQLFVLAGDLNADPFDGDSRDDPARLLLDTSVFDTSLTPSSTGGPERARLQGGINLEHEGDPRYDSSDFVEPPGNLRVDYVLPSRGLIPIDAGVFWPEVEDPLSRLVDGAPMPSSDHRLVWMTVRVP